MVYLPCPTGRNVSDQLYDLIHDLFSEFDDIAETHFCLSGSFSLNAYGVIDRAVSDVDLCVSYLVWETVIEYLSQRFPTASSFDGTVAKYSIYGEDGPNLCVYYHKSFPSNLGEVNIHGRFVKLYPAIDIIRYKVAALCDKSSTMTEKSIRKHMADIASFLERAPRQSSKTIRELVFSIIKSVNDSCELHDFSIRYDTLTSYRIVDKKLLTISTTVSHSETNV